MADITGLQKKLVGLIQQQLSDFFTSVKLLSYKPSAKDNVSGSFIGDGRKYHFAMTRGGIGYLPFESTEEIRIDAIGVAPVCKGTNHPCKGEKGTRCVSSYISCKQKGNKEILNEIADTSSAITRQVSPSSETKSSEAKSSETKTKTQLPSNPKNIASDEMEDISLYDFVKHYAPWKKGGQVDVNKPKTKTRGKTATKARGERVASRSSAPKDRSNTEKPLGLPFGRTKTSTPNELPSAKAKPKKPSNNPYDLLGVDRADFKNDEDFLDAASQSYKKLAKKYSAGDRYIGGNHEAMQNLNKVYEKIKDWKAEKRAAKRNDSRIRKRRNWVY